MTPRDRIDAAITKRDFRNAGVTLVSVMDYTEDSAIGDLVATVLDGVPDSADMLREEIFGPVAALQTFKSEDEVVRRMNVEMTPHTRRGTVEDVAATVAFLCSPGGGFINGQTIAVDGGWTTTKYLSEFGRASACSSSPWPTRSSRLCGCWSRRSFS